MKQHQQHEQLAPAAAAPARRVQRGPLVLGAAVSALFANDGAALILAPIVIAMLLELRFSARATLAFVMAAGFIADTASLPLVVSNLVNIVSADYFDISFGRYAAVMVPVNLVSVAATLAVLLLFFRDDIPKDYDVRQIKDPRLAIRDQATFTAGWWVLGLLLLGFFGLEPLGVPISVVAAAGAAVLFVVAARGHVIATREVIRNAPWQIVVFSLGMYLVVYGLRNAGLRAGVVQPGTPWRHYRRDEKPDRLDSAGAGRVASEPGPHAGGDAGVRRLAVVQRVNTLRLLGRWMRMFTIPNPSSVPMAYKEFDDAGRMRPSA